MRRKLSAVLRAAVCALFLLTLATSAHAQFRAGLQGTVTDQSGAVVPAATLSLRNNETGRVQTATSGDEGFYRISELPPGTYTLTIEKVGFKKTSFENIAVNAEQVQGLDVVLTAGEVAETVTVTADQVPTLETENANVSRAITTQEVLRLPQFGRDPYELARLTPGVFGSGARSSTGGSVGLPNTSGPGGSNNSIFQTENQVPISANGQRVSANNFQVDGVSVNSQTWGGAAVITPSQEAVKEVRVLSSTYSAEDGRNSGAQIKVVTQNGTNEFHGSLFFKYNDPGLNSFNDSPFTRTRVENKFRQFGGSLGGRVISDKLFFFFAYEGLRNNTNTPYREFVETAEYRQLIRNARPNSVTARVLGSAGVEPRIIQVLPSTCANANIPTPPTATGRTENCRVVAGGLDIGSPTLGVGQYVPSFNAAGDNAYIGGGFDGIPDIQLALLENPTTFRGHQFHTRIDYNISERQNIALTTIFVPTRSRGADVGARSRPHADINSERLNWNAALIYNRTLSQTAVNEARFNVTRWGYDEVASNPDVNFGIPRIEVEGYGFERIRFGAARGEGSPGIFKETSLDFRDTLTWVVGTHALKFGAELRREINNGGLTGGARPLYSFTRLWNLANDTPIFEAINLDPNTGQPTAGAREVRTGNYGFFVQDDWKFRPNITLNLGLRYELFQPITVSDGQFGNLVFGSQGLSNARVVAVDRLHETDKNNFGPQLGFAWSPNFGDSFGGVLRENRAVVRGGFGIGYNRLPNALLLNARANPPFFARYNICCGTAGVAGGDGFGSPFVDGQIVYGLGSDSSPFGYPVHPALAQGLDPATGAPRTGAVEIYGSEPSQPNAYVYRYSLEGQYELPFRLTGTLGYQGSTGHKLVRIVNQNFVYAPNPSFFAVYFATPDVNTSYNAMNARLQRRFDRGFQIDAQYRWAKSLDTVSYDAPTHLTNQTFPADNHTERGPSDYDVKHYFTLSGLWDLPVFRGRNDWVGRLLGGWQVNGIVTAHSGFPWTPKLDSNIRLPNGNFFGPIRPVGFFGGALNDTSNEAFLRPNGNFPNIGPEVTIPGTCIRRNAYFITSTFPVQTNPPDCNQSGGNPDFNLNFPGVGRNSFRGPRYRNVDISLAKRFSLASLFGMNESAGLDLRANFFNIFNIQNLKPFLSDSNSVFVTRSQFGQATEVLAGRVIELQARFNF